MLAECENDPAEPGGREAVVSSVPPLLLPLDRVSNVPTATLSVGKDLGLPAVYFVAG